MKNVSIDQAAEALKTVANPARLRIVLALMAKASLNVSSLQHQLQMEQSVLSQHLTKLKDKQILTSQRQGKEIHYRLADPVLAEVIQMMLVRATKKDNQ